MCLKKIDRSPEKSGKLKCGKHDQIAKFSKLTKFTKDRSSRGDAEWGILDGISRRLSCRSSLGLSPYYGLTSD